MKAPLSVGVRRRPSVQLSNDLSTNTTGPIVVKFNI